VIDPFPTWFTDRYADLPLLRPRVEQVSDDDIDFHGDISYYRSLLAEIVEDVVYMRRGTPAPWPIVLSDELAHASDVLAELGHTPDPARELLAAWKQEASGRCNDPRP